MKNIWIALFAATCFLGSCTEATIEEATPTYEISISKEQIFVSSEGESFEVTVTSSADWRMAGTCDWITPSATEGKSGDKVTFVAAPNTVTQARDVQFKFFTGSAVATLKVSGETGYILDLQSEDQMVVPSSTGTMTVVFKTNIDELTPVFSDEGAQWLKLNKKETILGKDYYIFDVSPNLKYAARKSKVTFALHGLTVDVDVEQRQLDVVLIDKVRYDVDPSGSEITINTESNVDYLVEIADKYKTWITRGESSTGGLGANGLPTKVEKFTVAAGVGLRGALIVFKTADGSYVKKAPLRQGPAEMNYINIPDDNFRNWLLDRDYIVAGQGVQCEISQSGLEVKEFNLEGLGIKSFEGLKYFSGLTNIKPRDNAMNYLDLGSLMMTNLDTGMLGSLTAGSVTIISDNLETARLYWCPEIVTVDMSKCPALKTLNLLYCAKLETLYLKTGQEVKINESYGKFKTVYVE